MRGGKITRYDVAALPLHHSFVVRLANMTRSSSSSSRQGNPCERLQGTAFGTPHTRGRSAHNGQRCPDLHTHTHTHSRVAKPRPFRFSVLYFNYEKCTLSLCRSSKLFDGVTFYFLASSKGSDSTSVSIHRSTWRHLSSNVDG